MNYEIRLKIANEIDKSIEERLNLYYELVKEDNAFFSVYPLLFLEENFAIQRNKVQTGMVEIKVTSWLLGEMIKRGANFNINTSSNKDSYETYKRNMVPILRAMYIKSDTIDEIKDTYSICSAKIVGENNKYQIYKSFPIDKYKKEDVYFNNRYDFEKYERDQKIINRTTEMIVKKFVKSKKHPTITLHEYIRNIDLKIYEACKERVSIDISEKLGKNIKSDVIGSTKELISILGYLYYAAMGYHTRTQLTNDSNYIFALMKQDLVNKLKIATSLSEGKIQKYLDYFTFLGKGTLNNFPLVKSNEIFSFIPSSIILNDWQFSIVSGHYMKNIDFKNRDKSISQNVIEMVRDSLEKFENIECVFEHYYELLTESGNSDIDIAIYCKNQETLLIIEAKWIDNHYKDYDDEKFSNIYSTLNKIYDKQLKKHKSYLSEGELGLSKLFSYPINPKKIGFIAVDKRSQIHTNEKHMLSVYVLLLLIEVYTEKNQLNLSAMIDEINCLETGTEYIEIFSIDI